MCSRGIVTSPTIELLITSEFSSSETISPGIPIATDQGDEGCFLFHDHSATALEDDLTNRWEY